MGDEIRVSGHKQSYSGNVGGLLKLARPLTLKLGQMGIDLAVFDSDDNQDRKATAERIKNFLELEKIDPTEQGITEYLKWLDENQETLNLCAKIEKETGISIYIANNGVKLPKASAEYLKGFLSTVFGIDLAKVNLKDSTDSFITIQKRYFDGITSIAYDQLMPDPKLKDLPAAEKVMLHMRANELSKVGISLIVYDDKGIDESASFAKIKNFLKAMGIEDKENFDKFISFINDLKGADQGKKLAAAKLVVDGKEGDSAAGIPKYVTVPMDRAKEIKNFNLLAEKINRGYKLLVMKDEKNTLAYYWLDPSGKVVRVADDELKVIEGSIIPTVLRGGFWERAEQKDPIAVYKALRGSSIENLLAYQSRINGIKPDTIRELDRRLNSGRTIKEIIDGIKEKRTKVEEAYKEFLKIKKQLDSAKGSAAALAKQTVDSFKEGDSGEGLKKYAAYNAAKKIAQAALYAAQAKAKEVEEAQKTAQKALKEELDKFKADEKDADAVIGYMEMLQSVWLNSGDVVLENVVVAVETSPRLTGTSLKRNGTLIAIFDKDIVQYLLPKPPVKPASAQKDIRVISKDKASELISRPIILIKAVMGGVEGNPYNVDLSTEGLNSRDLLNIVDFFSPRYRIDALGYYKEEEQLKALNIINKRSETYAKDSPERKTLNKLFESIRGDEKTFFTKEELNLLSRLLPEYKKDADQAKAKVWEDINDKIFSVEGKWRVRQTRSGLDDLNRKKLIDFANANSDYKFATLMPQDGDAREIIEAKSILRTIAKQLGDSVKRPKLEGFKDFFNLVTREIKSSAKVTQEIELPQGVEDQVWMIYRWDHLPTQARTEFTSALESARKVKQEYKTFTEEAPKRIELLGKKEEEIDKSAIKLEEKQAKKTKIQAERDGLVKEQQEKKEAAQKALEKFQEVIYKDGLDGRVTRQDIETILSEADLNQIWPYLQAVMVDQNGLRLNEVLEINTLNDLKKFMLAQIGSDGWSSLIRDPGEEIKLSIVKKLISIILSQKYFNKMRQSSMIMAIPALLPFTNTTRLLVIGGLGVASYGLDKFDPGVDPNSRIGRALTPSYWMYNVPGLKQLANLSQVVKSEPNTNIAPYVHIFMVQIGTKDSFYIYEKMAAEGMGKVTREDLKVVVDGLGKKIKELDPYTAEQIEKEMPAPLKKLWKTYRNGENVWKLYFEGIVKGEGSFELFVSGRAGKAMIDVVQLGFSILATEADMIGSVTAAIPGDHLGAPQIDNSLGRGIAYKPANISQTGTISANEAGYKLTSFSVGDMLIGGANTTLDFMSMQGMFFELGIQYTKDLLQGVEDYYKKDDPTKLLEAAKSLVGLSVGATLWGVGFNPFASGSMIPYFTEAEQLWKEGQKDKAIGAFVLGAKYFIDVMRYNMYRIGEARNFLMDRPSQLKAPLTFFNWPMQLTDTLIGRPLRWTINKVWSPESRLSGESWASKGLLKFDTGLSWLGVTWDRKWEYAGKAARKIKLDFILDWTDRFSLSPTLRNRWWQMPAGVARTVGIDYLAKGIVGLEFQQRYYAWGSQNRFFGLSVSTELIMRRQIKALGMEVDRVGKVVSFLKQQKITPDLISPSNDSIVTVEYGTKGALIYKEGNPVALYNSQARLKTLPKSIEVGWEGVGKHPVPVREIKMVAGGEIGVEIFKGQGGVEYARLIVGEDILNGEGKIDFTEAVSKLQVVEGSIFDGIDMNAPDKPAKTTGEIKAEEAKVAKTANKVDDIWEKYKPKLEDPAGMAEALKELGRAAEAKDKLPADFEKMSFEEQLRVMEKTKVKIGGMEVSYLEARLAWVRALVYKQTGGKITLTTPQLKGILVMHDGFSAQMYTGEGKTIVRCALDILDAPMGRKMIALTHNDLTAEANYNETRKIYEEAGIKVKFVRYTDAGLPKIFSGNQVIYLSMNDLAFIELKNITSFEEKVDIPYKQGLFRVDEFDFIYIDEGLTPYIMAGGENSRAEIKAWKTAWKTAMALSEYTDYTRNGEEGIELTEKGLKKKIFQNEKGDFVMWNELPSLQQKRIIRSLQAKHMPEGVKYAVDYLRRDILVINEGTGQIKYGSTFSDGLHQALQAKHEGRMIGTRITPESATIAQVLAKTLVRRLEHVVASSGTLDAINPVLHKVGINFIEVETNVPRYEWRTDISYEQNLANIKDLIARTRAESRVQGRDLQIRGSNANEADIKNAIDALKTEKLNIASYITHDAVLSPNYEAKIDAIIEQAVKDIKADRPIIISADNPILANEVLRRLKAHPAFAGKNIEFLAWGGENLYQKFFETALDAEVDAKGRPHAKIDVLVTTLARRATDIKVKNPKGAFLYLIDQEEGSWGEKQKSGRAGRQGTSATLRVFTSPECGIYSAKLGADNYNYVSRELAGKVNLSGITPESTFREVLELLYENKIDQKSIEDFLKKKVEVNIGNEEKEINLMDRAQEAFDKVLFQRWEEGARIEKLLPNDLRQKIDDLRKSYGEWTGTPKDNAIVRERAKGIVADELGFLWKNEGLKSDIIDLDTDPARMKGFREALKTTVARLGKMFGVQIEIEIPTSGKFSFSDFANKLSAAITDKLFDFSKMANKELRGIFGVEYLMFEKELKAVEDELIRKYQSEGKLLAKSGEVTVAKKARDLFLKEYKIALENLLENYRRRIVERVKAERISESVPLVGKYSRPGRMVRALGRGVGRLLIRSAGAIKVRAESVFIKPTGEKNAEPNAKVIDLDAERAKRAAEAKPVDVKPEPVGGNGSNGTKPAGEVRLEPRPQIVSAEASVARAALEEAGIKVVGEMNGAMSMMHEEVVRFAITQLKANGVEYIAFDGEAKLTKAEFIRNLLPAVREIPGRKLIIFSKPNGAVKAYPIIVPDGAIVEFNNGGYEIKDSQTGHLVDKIIMHEGTPDFMGGWESADQLKRKYGPEAAERILRMRAELKVVEPKVIRIEGKNISDVEALVKAVEAVDDGEAIIIFQSSQAIKIRGKASDFNLWLEGGSRAEKAFDRIVKTSVRANLGMPKEYIAGFLAGKRAQIAAQVQGKRGYIKLSVPLYEISGTKSELIEKFTTFTYEAEKSDGTKIRISIKIEDWNALTSDDPEVRKKAELKLLQQIKAQYPEATSSQIFKALKAEAWARKTGFEAQVIFEKKFAKVGLDVFNREMAKYAREWKTAGTVRRSEIISAVEADIDLARKAYEVEFTKRLNEYIKTSGRAEVSSARMEEIWKGVEVEQSLGQGRFAEYLSNAGMGGAAKGIAFETGKAGLMGLGVGLVMEGASELISKDPNLGRLLKNSVGMGLEWARFGAMCSGAEYLMGWGKIPAMGFAMALPAIWDLGREGTPYELKGRILFSHAASTAGFVLGLGAGNAIGLKFPKLGGPAGMALGMGLAWVGGKVNNYYYRRSETWRSIVDSRPSRITGSVLGSASYPLTAASVVGMGAGILGRTAAYYGSLELAGVPMNLAGRIPAWIASRGAVVLRGANIAMLAGLTNTVGFNLYYELGNKDYEKTVAQRLGKMMYENWVVKSKSRMLGAAFVTTLGVDSYKYDDFVDRYAENFTPPIFGASDYKENTDFVVGINTTIGNDFTESLSLGRTVAAGYIQQAYSYLYKEGNGTGDVDSDSRIAQEYLTKRLGETLSKQVVLTENEAKIFEELMIYLKTLKNIADFSDKRLVDFVANWLMQKNLDKDDVWAQARGILDRFSALIIQNQVKQILLVNPEEMGRKLYELLDFWTSGNMAAMESNPFKGSPIMRMGQVRELHNKFAGMFDGKGVLNPGMDGAFAHWILHQPVGGRNFKDTIKENNRLICEKESRDYSAKKVKADTELAAARKEAESLQAKYVYYRRLQLTLLAQDKIDEAKVSRTGAALAYLEKKMQPAMLRIAKAQMEIDNLKIQILMLQSAWFHAANPIEKMVHEARIKALGGSVKGVDEEYVKKTAEYLKQYKEIDPKKELKKFERLYRDMLKLVEGRENIA